MAVSPQQGYTCGLLPAHRSDEAAACSSCHIVGAGRRLSGACLPLASAQLRHGESSCLFLLGPPGCASTQDGTRSQQAVCVSLDLHKTGQSVAATAPQHLSQSLVTSAGSAAAWARLGDAQKLGACRGDTCTQSIWRRQQMGLILPVTPGRRDQLPDTAQIWVWARPARGMFRQARRSLLTQSSWQPDYGRGC